MLLAFQSFHTLSIFLYFAGQRLSFELRIKVFIWLFLSNFRSYCFLLLFLIGSGLELGKDMH